MSKKKKLGGGLWVDGKLVHRTKPRETKPDPQRIAERLARGTKTTTRGVKDA